MKAITIWQPWASLLACGAKKFETRSWSTSYRGPIAIHAGIAFNNSFPEGFAEVAHASLKKSMPGFTFMHELPRGAIIATAELVNCWYIVHNPGTDIDVARHIPIGAESMTQDKHAPDFADYFIPSEREMIFGNWTPGRYAWEIANIKLLDTPIPAKGKQGLWNWEAAQAGKGNAG